MTAVKIMKMETLKCFRCNIEKPLTKFAVNNRKYQLKHAKGRCIVCKLCNLLRALDDQSVLKFNYETNKYDSINFKDSCEVIKYFEESDGEL